LLKQLQDSGISLKGPFGITGDISLEAARALDPDRAYLFYRDTKLLLMENFTDSTPAYSLVSSYLNIAEFAYKTSCHYARSGGDKLFLRDFAEYSRLARPWVNFMSIQLQQ